MLTEKKICPLNSSELGIYLDHPETTAYNLPYFLLLRKDVDIDKVKSTLKQLLQVHRHAYMRVCVDDEGNVGKYLAPFDFEVPIVQAPGLDAFEMRPFDILDAPLFRFAIYEIGAEKYLLIEFHHIVIDGTGIGVFLQDFLDLYEGKPVQAECCSAEEQTAKEQVRRHTQEYEDGKAYYESRFGGLECSSDLPFDKKEEAPRYHRIQGDLAITNTQVGTFVKAKNIKTSTFFLSVYTFLLAKMNMEKEALVCTVHNGRTQETARALGMFVKTIPFYAQFDADTTVDAFLAENNDEVCQSVANDLYSYVDIIRDLGITVEQFFGYQGDMYRLVSQGEPVHLHIPTPKDGMGNATFLIFRYGNRFVYEIDYRADLYEESTMRHLAELFDVAANCFLTCKKLADVELLTQRGRDLLDEFNTVDEELLTVDKTIIDSFYDNVAAYPDKVAVEYGANQYTYTQVDLISNKIANQLLAWGIGREDVVSVLIPKCEYTVIASLGVSKALAAYQPLDPSYPAERLNFMMQDAAAKAVILDRGLEHIIAGYTGHKIYLDEIPALADDRRPALRPQWHDLFNLIYTSGTTGLPKGVMIEHANVATMCALYNKHFEGGSFMKSTSYASYGFDAHMVDLYPALVAGGTVCVIPEKMRLDLVALGEYFNAAGITHTSITTQVGRQFLEEIELKTLRHFLVGGEKLVPVEPAKGFVFHNAYGPSEGTVFCSEQPVDKLYYRVPIGKKTEDFKAYIVDENMHLLPWGVKGELCIAGPQVARGYLNREAESKKAFVANPFDTDPNFGAMYKTGDIVRMLSDGTLDFIGRNDGQVKIRGFRVELTEIEQIIRQYPGIKDVTVKDFTDPSGIKFVVAYVVADAPVDVAALNAFIGKNKPPYMIPAFTMQIDKIPLTQNQKVNKRALPQPEMKAAEMASPEGEAEQTVYQLLAGILGHKSFGVTTDVYEAGLSSVTAIKFAVQLSKAFGKTLRTSDIGEHSTVRLLAAYLGDIQDDVEYQLQSEYPLTKLQEGIFVECTTQPGTTVYNIPLLLKLDPAVDIDRLEKALDMVIDAHPYLKTRLKMTDGGDIVATRDDQRKIAIEHIDLATQKGGLHGLVRPFDLTKDDLMRAAIVREGKDTYLFVDAHHIVFDGESLVVFMRELDQACQGTAPAREQYTGFEVALAEAKRLQGEGYQKAKAYYEELLGAVDTECMPIRDRDEGKDRGEEFSIQTSISKKALGDFLAGSGATVNALWNAAFGYALAKFLAREDCVYTTVYNGRSDARLQNSVGMYVHTLPMVYRNIAGEQGKDAVRRVAKQLTDNMRNDIYPFAEISRHYGVKANVMFVYEGNIGVNIPIAGKPTQSVKLQSDALKADLTFFVFETEEGFRVDCLYNARYYEDWSMRSLVESTIAAMQAFVRNEMVDQIRLLSAKEKARLDATFEAHDVEDTDIVTLFCRMAQAYPDRDAVIFRDKHVSYRELDRLTDNLAYELQHRGIGKEDVVSILVPRSEYMVIAAVGVLKAGAAYEPLDPSYPAERLCFMVQNARAKLVIADASLTTLLPNYYGDYLLLDEIAALPDAKPQDPNLDGNNLFIMLYTSGTTGTPKGVMLEHHNLVNFCAWYHQHYALTAQSVVAAYASFGFDADMMDLYPALTKGAAIYIIPEDMRLDLGTLDQAFQDNKVSHVFMTTQMGRMFAENMPGNSLTCLSVGGETLAPVNPPKHFALWNAYGPTECTIFSTICQIDRLYYRNPIGRALWNYRLYVVGKNGEELPVGALGELWVAGAGVGRGYLDLPEQTKKAFISNPFDQAKGFDRVYRTGDIVRRLADGSIDFVGRNDGQVKIRGFRIELGEVEGIIRDYPGIQNVTVQAFDDKAFGGKYLAAYVVSDSAVDFGALADFIKSKKPPYMVPAAFMQLDSIPLNQNQKVNKRALPLPVRNGGDTRAKTKPSNDMESAICKIFAGVLGLADVEATDNFFDLGGTSISAAKVVMLATQKQYPVAYKDIFDNPTARQLAQHISGVSAPAQTTQMDDLESAIGKIFASVLGLAEVEATDNFFDLGGTSISAAKVVMLATQKQYPVAYKDIFDNPTAKDLAKHIREASGAFQDAQEAQAEETKEEALKCNVVRLVDEISPIRPLGRTLLAGATGFLGSHILKELLSNGIETVVLCRGNKDLDAQTRLSAMYAYYFDAPIEDDYAHLVKVIDGDITNEDLAEKLANEHIDTIINSAACVKHFAADDSIERINVGGVQNLIEIAKAHGARLVQISTLSVAGENVDGKFLQTFRMAENQLYFGQDISNKYVHSKFMAEQSIIRAIDEGLDAKMIRAGNLMGRQCDGEFQINSITNSFIKSLRAYKALGYFPVSACDATVDFSPIDEVAKAVVLLAQTDKKFTVFHAANSHEIQMGDVIAEMNRKGFPIEIVPDQVFGEKMAAFMQDGERSMLVSSLLTYLSSDRHVHTFIKSDNTFTIKALYRLGFRWPITDGNYLGRVIEGLESLGYFDRMDM